MKQSFLSRLKPAFMQWMGMGSVMLFAVSSMDAATENGAVEASTTSKSESLAENQKILPGEDLKLELPKTEEGQQVLLKVSALRYADKMAGYGYYVRYLLNGKPLNASLNRIQARLVNKDFFFRRPNGSEIYWNIGDGLWHTFFSPDFTTDAAQYGPKLSEDPYTVVLDITDLIRQDAPNVFIARSMIPGSSNERIPIVVSAEIQTKKMPPSQQEMPKSIALKGKASVQIAPEGGFNLVFGDIQLPFESRYSFPGGGYNEFVTEPGEKGEEGWAPTITQISDNLWEVEAKGATYSLKRVVELHAHRVSVRDTITNLTAEPQGVLISHQLNFKEHPILSCRMSGLQNDSLESLYTPDNSTAFYPLDQSGLGIVLEDDVFRNQSLFFYDLKAQKTGIKNEVFALDANASYTGEWSVYWTPTSEYFDFINLVRNDWGSNIPVLGPYYFCSYHQLAGMTDEQVAELLKIHNPEYVIFWEVRTTEPSPKWDNKIVIGHGPGMLDSSLEGEIEKLRTAIARIRRVAPDVKLSLYNIAFFMTPERPDDLKYQDSWVVDPDGKRRVSTYNNAKRVDFQPVFPTMENSFGKDYLKSMDFYLNDLGMDWIYWDESTGPGITNSDVFIDTTLTNRSTYNTWDGHTARINKRKKTIEQPFALLPLITRPLFADLMQKAEEKGSFILFNSSATTKQRIGMPSFVETQFTSTRAYNNHLNTPLAYGYGKPTMSELRRALNYGLIYARTHLDYESSIVEHFYPFTPIALHEGWVKGKERIITSLSGDYGWDKEAISGQLLLWDAQGKLKETIPVEKAPGEKVSITVPENGIAILERTAKTTAAK